MNTPAERVVLDHLALAWNQYLNLHVVHPDDLPDFRKAIHDAQRIILARPAIRAERDAAEIGK